MTAWPSLKKVISVWCVLTICLVVAFVVYLRSFPPDELVMGNDLAFELLIGFFVVGLPSVFFLFLVLLFGAIAKRWFVEPVSKSKETKDGPVKRD
jgi:hypothetical protein